MEKESFDGEKGSVRTFLEVNELAKQTEKETNVDSHVVMLSVMRFFRKLPAKTRLAIVTQDPGTYAQLLLESIGEIADQAIQSATVNKAARAELPPRVGVRGTPPKPAQPSTSGAHATGKHPPK